MVERAWSRSTGRKSRTLHDAIVPAAKHPAAVLGEELGWGIEVGAIDTFDAPLRGGG
jgi:hypothetical protein